MGLHLSSRIDQAFILPCCLSWTMPVGFMSSSDMSDCLRCAGGRQERHVWTKPALRRCTPLRMIRYTSCLPYELSAATHLAASIPTIPTHSALLRLPTTSPYTSGLHDSSELRFDSSGLHSFNPQLSQVSIDTTYTLSSPASHDLVCIRDFNPRPSLVPIDATYTLRSPASHDLVRIVVVTRTRTSSSSVQ
eukprot:207330-Rhodomonas_salina.1